MAVGDHIERLRFATAGSSSEQVRLSADAWLKNAGVLDRLATTLETTASEVVRGFSDGVTADPDGVAVRGSAVFLVLRDQVTVRRDQMGGAGTVLTAASDRLSEAEKARDGLPADPGEAPRKPSVFGAPTGQDTRALREYGTAKAQHDQRSADYADADERARRALVDLDTSYGEASRVLAEIHATPVDPEDLAEVEEESLARVLPRVLGTVAAGALVTPALLRGAGALRAAVPGTAGPAPRTIGTTSRVPGASTLGRTGGSSTAGAPSRATAGAPVAARGAGARGAGARGGRRRDDQRPDHDLPVDPDEWLDDAGAGPRVLG